MTATKLDLTNKERKQYSILNAINQFLYGSFCTSSTSSFEREVHDHLAKRTKGKPPLGILIPIADLTISRDPDSDNQSRDLNTSAFSSGGSLVQTTVLAGEFIDILRNLSVAIRLGARELKGLRDTLAIPKQTTDIQAFWLGENQPIPESEPTFSQVLLKPTTLSAITYITKRLLTQSSLEMEALLREDLARILALAIDQAVINGTGLNNQPLGILNNPNTNVVSLGTNGGSITYAALVTMLAQIKASNALGLGDIAWAMNPLVEGQLRITPTAPNGIEGNFILGKEDSKLITYPYLVSNQLPANLTKGFGTNLGSIICGLWNQVLIGSWGALEILPNALGTSFPTGGIQIRAMQDLDIAFRNDTAFSVIKDVVLT